MPSSNWLGHHPFKVEITGSNPVGMTKNAFFIGGDNIIDNTTAIADMNNLFKCVKLLCVCNLTSLSVTTYYSYNNSTPTIVKNSGNTYTLNYGTYLGTNVGIIGSAKFSQGMRMFTVTSTTGSNCTFGFYNNQNIQTADSCSILIFGS